MPATRNITDEEWQLLANIGEMFKELRKASGMTQRQAADKLNTSQARVPVLELGQADVMLLTLSRWANLYGYDVALTLEKQQPDEGEIRLDGDTVQKYTGGEWVDQTITPVQQIEEDKAA